MPGILHALIMNVKGDKILDTLGHFEAKSLAIHPMNGKMFLS